MYEGWGSFKSYPTPLVFIGHTQKMHITKNMFFVMCIFFISGKPQTQKNHHSQALGQIQAITHTITHTTHTALQSLNGATLTLRERSGVGVVGDEQVRFFGGDGACVDGVAEEAVYGFGGGFAVGGGVGEGEGGVSGGGVFGVDGEGVGVLEAGDDAQEAVEEGAAYFFGAVEGVLADGFEGCACQDAEGVFGFASVGEDLHDGVLAAEAQDPGDGGLGEGAFHDGVAGEGAGEGFVPDGVLCGAGCGGEQQVQDVGGEHGCVLEEDHLAAGDRPVAVEGVDDGGGVHQGGGHGGLLGEVWCVGCFLSSSRQNRVCSSGWVQGARCLYAVLVLVSVVPCQWGF